MFSWLFISGCTGKLVCDDTEDPKEDSPTEDDDDKEGEPVPPILLDTEVHIIIYSFPVVAIIPQRQAGAH